MEVESNIQDGYVEMATWEFFQRNEEPSFEVGWNTFAKLEELYVGVGLL